MFLPGAIYYLTNFPTPRTQPLVMHLGLLHSFLLIGGVPLFSQYAWPPVHENKGAEARTEIFGQSVNKMEIALWYIISVNQLSFILEYRKYIRFQSLETNLNLH